MLYLNWQLEPVLLGMIAASATAYYLAVGPLRRRIAPGEPYPTKHAIVFGIGLLALFLNEGSPLHDLAERYLLSAHMAQHLILTYAIAPILLAGTPAWLLRATLANRRMLPIMRVVLNPLMTFVVFSLALAVYHLPAFYDLSISNTSLHHSVHIILLFASLMVWWPIMSPIEELPRPAFIVRAAYLFLLPVAQLPIFAGITFSPDALYSAYAHLPVRAFGISVLDDQQLAGALMKVSGIVAFGIPFVVTFLQWFISEDKEHRWRAGTRP
ncbi:MAG: cytochrome c oxidase assembly protein [Truepera sp.]|jgi:putative membrane protein|nr:cytochrome c oxidase assembly protein [Truepera sp.]